MPVETVDRQLRRLRCIAPDEPFDQPRPFPRCSQVLLGKRRPRSLYGALTATRFHSAAEFVDASALIVQAHVHVIEPLGRSTPRAGQPAPPGVISRIQYVSRLYLASCYHSLFSRCHPCACACHAGILSRERRLNCDLYDWGDGYDSPSPFRQAQGRPDPFPEGGGDIQVTPASTPGRRIP